MNIYLPYILDQPTEKEKGDPPEDGVLSLVGEARPLAFEHQDWTFGPLANNRSVSSLLKACASTLSRLGNREYLVSINLGPMDNLPVHLENGSLSSFSLGCLLLGYSLVTMKGISATRWRHVCATGGFDIPTGYAYPDFNRLCKGDFLKAAINIERKYRAFCRRVENDHLDPTDCVFMYMGDPIDPGDNPVSVFRVERVQNVFQSLYPSGFIWFDMQAVPSTPHRSSSHPESSFPARSLQTVLHDGILRIGGYWSPLGAVANLAAIMGRLTERLLETSGPIPMDETAGLFIGSLLLANQYCIHLPNEIPPSPSPSTTHSLQQIIIRIGSISRIIKQYEGDSISLRQETLTPLQEEVETLHGHLLGLSILLGFNSEEAVRIKLADLFQIRHNRLVPHRTDPTTSPVLQRFQSVMHSSYCEFARSSRIWAAEEWDPYASSFEENMNALMPRFERFVRVSRTESIDLFVMEVEHPSTETWTMVYLASLLHSVLQYIRSKEAPCDQWVAHEAPDQHFAFRNQPLFILLFSGRPYPPTHPRFSGLDGRTFIMFQPRRVFERHHVTISKREMIRQAFENKGCPYDSILSASTRHRGKYIKPVNLGDSPIEWWNSPLIAT